MNSLPGTVPGTVPGLARSNGGNPHPRGSGANSGGGEHRSPVSSPVSLKTGRKRTQDTAGFDSSPGSGDGEAEGTEERRRQPGVKRACNECRQQKLRCDVVQEPSYQACGRCQRLSLDCKIESNFKRVGKRSKNAEMEREIVELRKQLASQQASPATQPPSIKASLSTPVSPSMSQLHSTLDQYMGSQEAVASLMDLRSGLEGGSFLRSPNSQILPSRRIEDVVLLSDRIRDLFRHFFTVYHPFLQILDPTKSPDDYYQSSTLLFWMIVAVAARQYRVEPTLLTTIAGPVNRLLWTSLADVPQSHLVVQAMCLLCTWPLPFSSTSSDQTFMLSGLMTHIALQIGLHRPSHAQDFTKFKVELREEELKDRVRTWAACNIIAQRVATGYGQPPSSVYDWTLSPSGLNEPSFRLPPDVERRLLIERFCNKVTKALYSNRLDPVGLVDDAQRSVLTTFLARDFEDLEERLGTEISSIDELYLRAAGLHLRLSAFFDSPTSRDYHVDLLALWLSTVSFLECAFNLQLSAGGVLVYATNYILQMIIAAGFTLLKLLNSFFANQIDLEYGRRIFNRTIWAIRSISVTTNDLPSRLAEVLAQLWRGGGAGLKVSRTENSAVDNSLQLKVKCRMSMSLVYDSVWRWREEFQASGRGNLESAVQNPTNPDSALESSASSVADPSLAPSAVMTDRVTPGPGNAYAETNYEIWDPLNWMLDGLVDLPSYGVSGAPELEV
ncbi:hypothetical protein MMC07_001707 [Pseudocyphellaria aurata]|nr:hypothetical protein [Pseudocyphellaria aurata]